MSFLESWFQKKYAGTTPDAPPPAEVLKQVINNHVAPVMLTHGFKKRGNNFYRDSGPLLYLLSLTGSHYNNTGDATFYVTVGILHKRCYEVIYGNPVPKNPQANEAQLVVNLSDIGPRRTPYQWDFNSRTNIDEVGAHMTQIINASVFEHFAKFPDVDSFAAGLSSKHNGIKTIYTDVEVGIVAALRGNKKSASKLLQQYLGHKSPGREAQRGVLLIAEEIGITVQAPDDDFAREKAVHFIFTLKGARPVHDERRSISKLETKLWRLSDKSLGYRPLNGQLSKYVPNTKRLTFYTLDPDEVIASTKATIEKMPVKPAIAVE